MAAFKTVNGTVGLIEWTKFEGDKVYLRYKILACDESEEPPAPLGASTQPAGGRLEFRVAPSASALDKAELGSYMDWLKAGKMGFWWKDGRIAGITGRMPEYAWLPIAGELTNAPGLITGQYQGRKYVLVSDKPGETMVPGEGENAWGLVKVYKTTDNSGQPVVGFELDERGAELFAALTKANVKNALAIVVDGKVLSAPVLMTALGKSGVIPGRFSEQKVKDLIRALKIGMPPATQPTEGGQPLIRGDQRPSRVQAARPQLAARMLEVEQRRLKLL
ncbi:MAG: hypothetical protein KAX78_00110, partial [Phycisphaerae bacterium]|nr:hypothetical protein [Phycisphaerae bacterium]